MGGSPLLHRAVQEELGQEARTFADELHLGRFELGHELGILDPHGAERERLAYVMKAESAQTRDGENRPPHDQRRWHAGYSVLAVATVAQLLTAPGQTLLVSLLNVPLREAFDIGALTLNTSYAIATIAGSLPLVWIGRLTDRIGPRRAMILVALAFGGACLFTAGVLHPAMVFVAFFLLRFLGQGSLSMVSGHAVAMWFHARLGRMEGILHESATPASALSWHGIPERWSRHPPNVVPIKDHVPRRPSFNKKNGDQGRKVKSRRKPAPGVTS